MGKFRKFILPIVIGSVLVASTLIVWAASGDIWSVRNQSGTDVARVDTTTIMPGENNVTSLGTDALEFKDIWIDGVAYLDSVDIAGGTIIGITDITVGDGGTGASTLLDHGVLVGSGTSAITPLAVGTDGKVLVGVTGADPQFVTLSGDIASITTEGVVDFTTVGIGDGGTNATTLTDHSVLLGSGGTDAVTALTVGADGYVLVGVTGADPGFVAFSGDIASITTAGVVDFTTVTVGDGGTGVESLTDHSILVGSGTSAVTLLTVGTDGQLMVGVGSADPQFVSVSGDINSITTAGVVDITALTVTTFACDSGEVGATEIADVVRDIQLPLMAFTVEQPAGTCAVISATTAPGLATNDLMASIVWADGETSPVQITFVVPTDYASGGAFKVGCSQSGVTTANQVDFDIYVNTPGSAFDASATNQTPVAIAGTPSTAVEVVTLTPATDFASLAAGDWVTARIWRDDTADGTDDLEVKGVQFFYTATQ